MHKGKFRPLAKLVLAALAAWNAMPIAQTGAQNAARPERIVSLNLCADQYLIELADPGQIAALTLLSRDRELSFQAEKAKAYPAIRGLAEEVLALDPDLLIVNPWGESDTLALLADFEIPTLSMGFVTSFAGIRAETAQLAAAIGQEARGEALIAQMEASLSYEKPADAAMGRSAVLFQRRGFTSGSGTLLNEVLTRAGLRNFTAEMGRAGVGRIGLEEIVTGHPDYLLLSEPAENSEDLGTELLMHPALGTLYPENKRLYLPQALIVCGGPAFPAAVTHLRAQIRERSPNP